MKKRQRKKTRSIASYRAASLKGARSKRQMRQLTPEQLEQYHNLANKFAEYLQPDTVIGGSGPTIVRRMIDEGKLKSIDLVPKVKWP